jgi:invasion protein IalB
MWAWSRLECDSSRLRANLSQGMSPGRAAFSTHSWLYCRQEFGYQAAVKGHAPAAFHTERAGCKASFGSLGPRTEEQGIIAMDHRIATVRPLGRALTTTLAGTLAAALMAAPAFAQQPPKPPAQKPAPAPAAPKQAPAAQPAPQTPAGQQQAGEQPQLMYSPWMKVCGKGPDTNNKQVCVITKDGRLENGMPVAIVQLFEPEGGQKVLRVTVPLGMQIAHGTRLLIDQGQPAQSPYNICFPVGCMADYPVADDLVAKLKKGQNIIIQAINMQGTPISLPLPLADFAKAYDGPPTDPKAFEEQQRKLQEELQKKAEEARKKLEGQQSQAPAAPAPK